MVLSHLKCLSDKANWLFLFRFMTKVFQQASLPCLQINIITGTINLVFKGKILVNFGDITTVCQYFHIKTCLWSLSNAFIKFVND